MESHIPVHPTHVPRSKKTQKKKRESNKPVAPERCMPPKKSRQAGGLPLKKDTQDTKSEMGAELKVKSTVVDIDSVREEVRDDTPGHLEAAADDSLKDKTLGLFEWLLMVFILSLVLILLPISIWFCVKVVKEHERAVVFRMGHLQRRPRGPGLIFLLPLIDVCHKVDIRLKMLNIPSHMAVTKDLVSVELTAVCYYQIENVALCSSSLAGLTVVLQNLVQTLSRDILAQRTFSYILQHRRSVGQQIQAAVDSVACRWGVRVDRADIEELTFPSELQQSLTAEAELKRHQQNSVKMTDGDRVVWDMFRSSFRHLHPALVLPFPSDVFGATHDYSCLPPPPPPPSIVEQEERPVKELETDSSMM